MKKAELTKKQRDNILKKTDQLRIITDQLIADLENAPQEVSSRLSLSEELNQALDELQKEEDKYLSGLSESDISRCPFTGEIYSLTIDVLGLDGLWWNAENPVRDYDSGCKSFFALTGSVNIAGEIPFIPFPVKPGPAVPWVSPRLLEHESIVAVLSHIKIGTYDAYVTVYYSEDRSVDIERINTWGTDGYITEDSDGKVITGSTFDDEEEYDFDIAPWIKKGKLKWIALDDKELELRESLHDCPYIGIYGYQYPVIIQDKTMVNCMIKLEYDEEKRSVNFCANCGEPVKKNTKFCANCGARIN